MSMNSSDIGSPVSIASRAPWRMRSSKNLRLPILVSASVIASRRLDMLDDVGDGLLQLVAGLQQRVELAVRADEAVEQLLVALGGELLVVRHQDLDGARQLGRAARDVRIPQREIARSRRDFVPN